jgi:hypothetical protein
MSVLIIFSILSLSCLMLAGLCIIAYFIQITEALPESVVAIVYCKEQHFQIDVDTMQTSVQLKEASLRQELQQHKPGRQIEGGRVRKRLTIRFYWHM